MIDPKVVGGRLKAVREILGLSEHELTAKLGFPWRVFERGMDLLPVDHAEKLLHLAGPEIPSTVANGLSLDWLYLGRMETLGTDLQFDLRANAEDDVEEDLARRRADFVAALQRSDCG